ncbi:MAG: substrate-binding domain-containing protein [Actinobacteria bacterium]|nr:substrate-binding domain-containing protein [Actinomycetota bacterium]MCG2802449.1 substrate-binding domain-containing protein [Cellulomonas sp.]
MKNVKLSIASAVAIAAVLAGLSATSASADPTPQSKDIVGVGSDTTQIALNSLADGYKTAGGSFKAGYNATNGARISSFDAINPITKAAGEQITLRVNTPAITRPNGSGAGKALLYGASNNAAVSFARSSSALSSTEVSNSLTAYPFAVDEVVAGVKAGNSYAPTALSPQQLVGIYTGTITNWNQVGGANATITALLPQNGSGTRSFFLSQLQAANGGTAIAIAGSVIQTVEEQDTSVFTTYNNAVVPISVGRANLAGGASFTDAGTASDGNAAFDAKRAVYNVVRGADISKSFVTSLFTDSGYLCSPAATAAIAAGGLTQLAVAPTGVCGQAYTTTAGVTNFTTN